MATPHPALLELAAGRPLPPVADGEALLASAEEHRMSGLLWSHEQLSEVDLPDGWKTEMALNQLRFREMQHGHWETLGSVLDRLESIGVGALTFKGVTAEARWYDKVGERPAGDIDVLVEPGSAARAAEIVGALDPGHRLVDHIESMVLSGDAQTATVRHNRTFIDIHFELPALGVPILNSEQIWDRSQCLDLERAGSVRVLDKETALIQLLLHLNKDCFARLLWYSDIVRLIRREPDLDWAYIDEFARSEGLEVPIYLSLAAVYDDLGLEIPVRPALSGWKRWLWTRLWSKKVRLQGLEGYYRRRHRRYALAFMFTGRKRQAVRWWLRQVFPSDAALRDWYPQARGPYVWRLVAARVGRAWENYREARRLRRSG